jgi:hypothetical protein
LTRRLSLQIEFRRHEGQGGEVRWCRLIRPRRDLLFCVGNHAHRAEEKFSDGGASRDLKVSHVRDADIPQEIGDQRIFRPHVSLSEDWGEELRLIEIGSDFDVSGNNSPRESLRVHGYRQFDGNTVSFELSSKIER